LEWEKVKAFDYAQLKIAVIGERTEEQLKEVGYHPTTRIDFSECVFQGIRTVIPKASGHLIDSILW